MDAEKFLQAFTPDETRELAAALPADVLTEEVVRRGLELPQAAGVVAVDGAMQPKAEAPTPDSKESLTRQWSTAFAGYQITTAFLNRDRHKKDQLPVIEPETLKEELADWLTDEKVAYVAAAQEVDSEVRFTLVATPNVLVNDKELARVAKEFGRNQPYETYVWDDLYSRYTPEQLSGTDPSNGKGVVFSLIPNKYTPDMDGTVVEQRAKFAKLQDETPDLKIPSPLEAVTHWQTLRTAGESLVDNTTFDRTYIRHFDLPEQRVGDWQAVPFSCVDDVGRPSLSRSVVLAGDHARVAVG